jgi:hypothetical protein
MSGQNIDQQTAPRHAPRPFWRGAGIIIYYTDSLGKIHVLVGNETKYLSDYLPKIKELEYIMKNSTFEQVVIDYGEIARNLSNTNLFEDAPQRMMVSFDIPVWKGTYWRTHFRIKPRINEPIIGILKGGPEHADISPLDNAVREISEITGMKPLPLEVKRIYTEKGFHHFSHEISEDIAQHYNTSIATTQFTQIGKMQHLEFVELSQLLYDVSKLNMTTTKILINLFGKRFPEIMGSKKPTNALKPCVK